MILDPRPSAGDFSLRQHSDSNFLVPVKFLFTVMGDAANDSIGQPENRG